MSHYRKLSISRFPPRVIEVLGSGFAGTVLSVLALEGVHPFAKAAAYADVAIWIFVALTVFSTFRLIVTRSPDSPIWGKVPPLSRDVLEKRLTAAVEQIAVYLDRIGARGVTGAGISVMLVLTARPRGMMIMFLAEGAEKEVSQALLDHLARQIAPNGTDARALLFALERADPIGREKLIVDVYSADISAHRRIAHQRHLAAAGFFDNPAAPSITAGAPEPAH